MTHDRELHNPRQRYGERLGRPTSAEALQDKVLQAEQDTLEQTVRHLERSGSVVAAAARVAAARRRFVTGAGKSYALAHLLATDLAVGLSQVQLVDAASGQGVNVISGTRDSDVLIAISLRRTAMRPPPSPKRSRPGPGW